MGRPKEFDRTEVLNKTIQVFWKKGFADTSVQDLEKATGLNKSSLYSEFESKEELFLSSLRQYFRTSGAVEILRAQPQGWDNVRQFMTFGQDCKGQKGCFGVSTIRELPILPPKARALLAENIAATRALLVENIRAGKSVHPAEITAELVLTFNAGLCLGRNFDAGGLPVDRIDLFLNSLRRQ